jgi:hypothetical protein
VYFNNKKSCYPGFEAFDKVVDLCYRPQPFINETKRIEFLFELYDKLTSGMFGVEKKKKNKNN